MTMETSRPSTSSLSRNFFASRTAQNIGIRSQKSSQTGKMQATNSKNFVGTDIPAKHKTNKTQKDYGTTTD